MSIVVSSGSVLNIASGAAYSDVVINSYGRVYVRNGGVLSKAVLNYSGYLDTPGNAYDVTVNAGGIVHYIPWSTRWTTTRDNGHVERISSGICLGSITNLVISGDFAAQNAVMSDCVFDISNHGIWLYNTTVLGGTVNSTANVYFSAGCVMSRTLIDHSYFAVHSGAAITDVGVKGGNVVINSGAYARDTIVTDGGVLTAGARIDGTILRGGSQVVKTISYYPGYGYGAAFDTVVSNGGVHIISGGTGLRTVVSAGGTESVVGGYAISTTVSSGGTQFVYGGSAVDTEVYGIQYQSGLYSLNSNIRVHSGGWLGIDRGTAARIAVDGGAFLIVAAATAGNVSAANGANVRVLGNGTVSGGVIDGGANVVMSGGTLKDLDVHCNLAVDNGNLYGIRLQSGAALTARLGSGNTSAYCSGVTVSGGAVLNISGGRFTGPQLAGGTVNNYGINFQNWCVSSGLLNNIGGTEKYTSVFDGGRVNVRSGGTEWVARVSGGVMELRDGSLLSSSYVHSGGTVLVTSGRMNEVVFSRGATLRAAELTATGRIYLSSGSVIDLLVSERTAGGKAIVDDFGKLSGTAHFYITVKADQEHGQYILAQNAGNFSGSMTVQSDIGATLGVVDVGGEISCGDCTYILANNDGTLSLAVESVVLLSNPADLNGDGRADVVMSITQRGHGAEGATGAWLIQGDQTAAWGDLSQRNAGWSIFGKGFTTAGKATADVYLKSDGNIVGAWTTDTTGKVTGWTTVGSFDSDTQVLGLGDFNADGQTDLLLRNVNGAVGCHLTNGTGWHYFQSLGDEWKIAAVGDLNGDGRDDVVLKHDVGFAGSWLTQDDCTMAWADLDTLQSGYSIVGTGDFNGDGTDDVLLKNGNYYGAWLVRNGNAAGWFGIGDLGNVAVEEIADYDADGIDDLRIRTAAGDLGVQLVKGADTLEWKYYGSVGSEWSTTLAAI